MNIKKGYVIRQVMGNYVIIATGEESRNFYGMVKLNETAANIWKYISEGKDREEIVAAMLAEYEVEEQQLRRDVDKTIEILVSQGLVEL